MRPEDEAILLNSSLIPRIKESEGWSSEAYLDTENNVTALFGHNFGRVYIDHGRIRFEPTGSISMEIGNMILERDLERTLARMEQIMPWAAKLDDVRREVLIELCFNIGTDKVASYHTFMGQLWAGQYEAAAANMRGWLWVDQVHHRRADPLIKMMETGLPYRP